ncbi:unnamed protein product [Arabidopsis thaliana]|uniref:Uncharacterized protein n=1 Tax=Arabidopsis thaliana TaxID=3702 RepID=A0A5S9WST5_ARATH|nr:unnamed protein product [Arabidopsis thaliana]
MTIPTKTLIAFVFSVIFIISYVHCATTTASAPGRGGPADATGHEIAAAKPSYCFRLKACSSGVSIGCIVYCDEANYAYAQCHRSRCCYYHKNENA